MTKEMWENVFEDLLTYSFPDYSKKRFDTITSAMARKFKLTHVRKTANIHDETLHYYCKDDKSLSVCQGDGYILCAENIEANSLVTEIAHFIHEKYS